MPVPADHGVRLRTAFSQEISEPRMIKAVVQGAGLRVARIDFSGGGEMVWFDVINHAWSQGKEPFRRLLQVAADDAPAVWDEVGTLLFHYGVKQTKPTDSTKWWLLGFPACVFPADVPLDEGGEMRSIEKHLREGLRVVPWLLKVMPAVEPQDIIHEITQLRHEKMKEYGLHFSGHGTRRRLLMRGPTGEAVEISPEAFVGLLKVDKEGLQHVVLNTCHSSQHAQMVSASIAPAIGWMGEVRDDAAITFASVLYRALGSGSDLRMAFENARASARATHQDNKASPHLFINGTEVT